MSDAPISSETSVNSGLGFDKPQVPAFGPDLLTEGFRVIRKLADEGCVPHPRYHLMSKWCRRLCSTAYRHVTSGTLRIMKVIMHLDGFLNSVNCCVVDLKLLRNGLSFKGALALLHSSLSRYHGCFVPWPTYRKPVSTADKPLSKQDRILLAHTKLNESLFEEPQYEDPMVIVENDHLREILISLYPNVPTLEDRRYVNTCESNQMRIRLKYPLKGGRDWTTSSLRYRKLKTSCSAYDLYQSQILHRVFEELMEVRRGCLAAEHVLTLEYRFERFMSLIIKIRDSGDTSRLIDNLLTEWVDPHPEIPDNTPISDVHSPLWSKVNDFDGPRPTADSLISSSPIPGDLIRELILSGSDATSAVVAYLGQRGVPPDLSGLLSKELGFDVGNIDSSNELSLVGFPKLDYNSASKALEALTIRSILGHIKEHGVDWATAEWIELNSLSKTVQDLPAQERNKIKFLHLKDATQRCKLMGFSGLRVYKPKLTPK